MLSDDEAAARRKLNKVESEGTEAESTDYNDKRKRRPTERYMEVESYSSHRKAGVRPRQKESSSESDESFPTIALLKDKPVERTSVVPTVESMVQTTGKTCVCDCDQVTDAINRLTGEIILPFNENSH